MRRTDQAQVAARTFAEVSEDFLELVPGNATRTTDVEFPEEVAHLFSVYSRLTSTALNNHSDLGGQREGVKK